MSPTYFVSHIRHKFQFSHIKLFSAILHLDISDEEMILMNSKKENPNPKIEKDLTEFNENWSKVTEQCSKIHKIENAEDQVTLDKIEDEILEIVRLESKPEDPEPKSEIAEPVKEPEPEPEPVEERPPSGRGRSADKKGGKGKKGSKSRPGSGKSKGSRGGSAKSGERPGSGASAKSSSSKGSKKSRSGSAKGKKKGKKEKEPEEPEIKPGDEKWEWVLVSKDENVPADFYHRLHQGLFYNSRFMSLTI